MSAEILKTLHNEREVILNNLISVRSDIKKFEAALKPKSKPPKVETSEPPAEDPDHEEDSDSL